MRLEANRLSVGATGRDLGNQVADLLAKDLFSGTYKPGDMLPKETELVDMLAVSRASVRSGLQTLAALGIVNRQVGQGTVVTEYRDWVVVDPLVTRWMVDYANPNPDFLREIFEFRQATEPYIAALAAQRATARDLLAMEEAFDGMERALDEQTGSQVPLSFSQSDIEFHAAIYRATYNLIWAQLAHILRPAILLVIEKTNNSADELRDSLGRHRHLMESIRLRQPEVAYDAAVSVMSRTGFDLGLGETPGDERLLALMRARSLPEND